MAARPTLPAVDRLGSRLSTNSEGVLPDKLHHPTVRRFTRFRALSPSPLIAGASASSLILWVGGAAGSAVGAVGKHLLEWGSVLDHIDTLVDGLDPVPCGLELSRAQPGSVGLAQR